MATKIKNFLYIPYKDYKKSNVSDDNLWTNQKLKA